MYDVIIIGKGPAGISASLYTVRANLKTLIIGKDGSALRKAGKIENYYGFPGVISGEELLKAGEKQAQQLGAEIVEEEVIAIEKSVFFEVTTSKGRYSAKALLLATGQPQKEVKINNLAEFEGRGVSYCSTCDGFFYRNLKVGILGYKDYAIHESMELKAFTSNITIFTNGFELELTDIYRNKAINFKIDKRAVAEVNGSDVLEKISFKDGSNEELDGLFVAYESASSIDFARKLGVLAEGNSLIVDKHQQTNIEGLFAAGDCIGGFKQISTAVGQGAMAGKKMIEYVRSLHKSA
jgi:thioredoxin reductase (NADPH)